MAGARSRWWTRRDSTRLLARAEASSGTVTSTNELVYLHGFCELLLAEVLPLADGDRERLRALHFELHRTLAERAGATTSNGAGDRGA
jgi:hypothetical protein